jgi:toxin-antitoxin system PIN domain toxin
VIAVDTNLLVYAHRQDAPFHDAAKQCLATLAEGPGAWAVPWPCLHEFLGVVTRPRIFRIPTPLRAALAQVDAWLASPTVVLLAEGPRYWSELREVLQAGRVAGARVHDARIAALCRAHGVHELWTADRDFSRFGGLVVRNPLLADVARERGPSYGRRARRRA